MMTKVVVKGWSDQRNPKPVSLVDSMRRRAGLSLPAAKKLLDDLAEHGETAVQFATSEQAAAFMQDAEAIGAIVDLAETDV
jgi:hypothetical protein